MDAGVHRERTGRVLNVSGGLPDDLDGGHGTWERHVVDILTRRLFNTMVQSSQ